MVEQTFNHEEMKLSLRSRCAEILSTYTKMDIKTTVDNGNIEVRADWDNDNKIICVAEMKLAKDLTPDEFKTFFLNVWEQVILDINPLLYEATLVEEQIIKTKAKAPWPISDRGMIVAKYLDYIVEPGVDQFYMSSLGVEDGMIQKHFTQASDCQKMVLATLFVSAWRLTPVNDEEGATIGTKAMYLYHAAANGSIPTWLQNLQGPKTAIDALRGAVNYLRQKKGLPAL